ncbi:30S ribosomal protein S8e [uncultured archaeon]|nr:30S ribosomal protein S8e [uncultured archaeon]
MSGGLRHTMRRSDKRLSWKGGVAALTAIADGDDAADRVVVKGLGRTSKVKVRSEKLVNVTIGGKSKALVIETVVENKADRQFARNNILTKGAVLKAKDNGAEVFVKVTNRPGQHGMAQGVILDKFVKEKDLKAEEGSKKEKKRKTAQKPQKKVKGPEEKQSN